MLFRSQRSTGPDVDHGREKSEKQRRLEEARESRVLPIAAGQENQKRRRQCVGLYEQSEKTLR